MALFDSLSRGSDFIDRLQNGRILDAQARYAEPMAAENYYSTHVNNQFLPEKLRLANQYQGLINSYYGPNITSEINQRNAETKYIPLKYAIEAQNSVRNNSRFSGASDLIRSVNSMKGGDQEIWLSNPENLAMYHDALKQVGAGVSNPRFQTVLTPELLQKFGFGGGLGGSEGAPMPPPQQSSPNAPPSGLGAPMPPLGQQPPMPPAAASASPSGLGAMPSLFQGVGSIPLELQTPKSGIASPLSMPQQAQSSAQVQSASADNASPEVKDAVAKQIAENAPNQSLTSEERSALAHQSMANQRVAGAKLWNRAQGAITLENLLQGSAEKTAKRILNAAQYSTALGQGKFAVDRLLNSNKEAYTDYKWFKQDWVPNIGNNIKVMEQLSSTDKQRKVLQDMFDNSISWDTNPTSSAKLINMSIGLLHDQAKATLKAAQPINPGVLEKLNGLKIDEGENYLDAGKKKYSDAELKKFADDAIKRGAKPEDVQKRMEELKNGKSV